MSSHLYRACGLTLRLPLPCAALLPVTGDWAQPDIEVVYGDTPEQLPAPFAGERQWQAEPGRFLYRMGRYGRYLVEDGRRITVTRRAETEDADVCFHLLYVCLAMALEQRGLLVLHANTVRMGDRAVAFAGESGAGKSTLLAALLAEGYPMLADDITVVDAPPVCVRPGFPHYKLCLDAAERLGATAEAMTPVRWRQLKVGVQAPLTSFSDAAAPLAAIFLLAQHDGATVTCTTLTGIEKFASLRAHSYGPDGSGPLQMQGRAAMAVAAATPVFRLLRPCRGWSLAAVVAAVKHQLAATVG